MCCFDTGSANECLLPGVPHEGEIFLERFGRCFLDTYNISVLAKEVLPHESLPEGPCPVFLGNMRLVVLRDEGGRGSREIIDGEQITCINLGIDTSFILNSI